MIRTIGIAVLVWMTPAVFCQAPAFDVASVKPNQMSKMGGEGSRREHVSAMPGSLNMHNVSLSTCIQWAYTVQEPMVSGPGWITNDRYDVVAKAGQPVTEDQLKPMLQTLLAERFKLAVHREEKVMSVFVLTVGKNGHKLHKSEGDGEAAIDPVKGKFVANVQRAGVGEMIALLARGLRTPVIDQTGLTGKWDFTLDVSGYATHPVSPDDVPSLAVQILQEQLGLKLESKKMPLEMLIVDHAERTPTEN